ncbi:MULTISPECIES: hypothetical protein [Pseudomonas]|uniref:hypothetical protein n=1 Tax=Pseudomonas sp. BC42 TaxID=2933816 RepID=UPI001E2D8669|nr:MULTISPECIES: hypothetical protein [Pseudomonas]ULT73967.1 hypothetical protein L1O02_19090 [Pseudomonas sp. BC42]
MNDQAVLPRQNEVSLGKQAEIEILLILEIKHVRIELKLFGGTGQAGHAPQCSEDPYPVLNHVINFPYNDNNFFRPLPQASKQHRSTTVPNTVTNEI